MTLEIWLGLVLLCSAGLVSYLLWDSRQLRKEITGVVHEQTALLDKVITLVRTGDPMTYQAVQAMHVQYPETQQVTTPAPEYEERDDDEDELNGIESSVLAEFLRG